MSEYGKICGEVEVLDEHGAVVDRVNNTITRRGLHWFLAMGFGVMAVHANGATGAYLGEEGTFGIAGTGTATTGYVNAPYAPNNAGQPSLRMQAGTNRRYSDVFGGVADVTAGPEIPAMLNPFRFLVLSSDTATPSLTTDLITNIRDYRTTGADGVSVSWFVEASRFGLLITSNYVAIVGGTAGVMRSIGFQAFNRDRVDLDMEPEPAVSQVGAYALLTTPFNRNTDTRTINYRLFVNT